MTDRPNLKQIRIKRSVCDRLDDRKGKDDSYTDVVKELLDENERLKERVEELKQDKENITEIAKNCVIGAYEDLFDEKFGEALLQHIQDTAEFPNPQDE